MEVIKEKIKFTSPEEQKPNVLCVRKLVGMIIL